MNNLLEIFVGVWNVTLIYKGSLSIKFSLNAGMSCLNKYSYIEIFKIYTRIQKFGGQ